MNAGEANNHQHVQCEHQKQKASRLRGGGAGKVGRAFYVVQNHTLDFEDDSFVQIFLDRF